jgi:hypothetical protein
MTIMPATATAHASVARHNIPRASGVDEIRGAPIGKFYEQPQRLGLET